MDRYFIIEFLYKPVAVRHIQVHPGLQDCHIDQVPFQLPGRQVLHTGEV